jgi:hypothetical protein
VHQSGRYAQCETFGDYRSVPNLSMSLESDTGFVTVSQLKDMFLKESPAVRGLRSTSRCWPLRDPPGSPCAEYATVGPRSLGTDTTEGKGRCPP